MASIYYYFVFFSTIGMVVLICDSLFISRWSHIRKRFNCLQWVYLLTLIEYVGFLMEHACSCVHVFLLIRRFVYWPASAFSGLIEFLYTFARVTLEWINRSFLRNTEIMCPYLFATLFLTTSVDFHLMQEGRKKLYVNCFNDIPHWK
jgi:hypothetical protein